MNQSLVKDGRLTEAQFGGFLVQCLKGTYSEKADVLCLFADQVGGEVADHRLFKVP